MIMVLGLSGSLRSGPYNTAVLRAAAGLVPLGATIDIAVIGASPGGFVTSLRPAS